MIVMRSSVDGMMATLPWHIGVGGRQPYPSLTHRGGGYLDICSIYGFAVRPQKIAPRRQVLHWV